MADDGAGTRRASRTPCPSSASPAPTFTNAPNAAVIFIRLTDFDERARTASTPTEHQHAAQSEVPASAGRPCPERVPAAGPRPRHRRRLQARDPGHGGGDSSQLAGGGAIGDGRRQADAGPHQHLHHLPPARRRSGPMSTARTREMLGVAINDVFTTLSLSRLAIRERLQLPRPHLPGDGAGGRPFRRIADDMAQSQDAERERRDGAARHRSPPSATSPAPSRRALQPVPVRRRCKAHASRATQLRSWPSPPWRRSSQQRLPTGFGREWTEIAYRRSSPATPRSSCSSPRVLFVFLAARGPV